MRSDQDHKIVGLEALRFLCAFSVVVFHYSMFAFVGTVPVGYEPKAAPFYNILFPFLDRGFFAVPYFWCISGFIFFWKYQFDVRNRITGREFFVYRFSRLYPLHLATLLLIAILQTFYMALTRTYFIYPNNKLTSFTLHLLMLGNLSFPYHLSFNGVIWSVSFEVFVYITFFLICRYSRHPGIAAALIGPLSAIIWIGWFPESRFQGWINESQLLQCLSFFYFGGIACIVHRWLTQRRLTFVSSIILLSYYWVLYAIRNSWPPNGYFRMVICIPPTVLAFACLPIHRIVPKVFVQGLGNLTYSSYLLHFPVVLTAMIVAAILGRHLDYRSPYLLVTFVTTVFGMAPICYRYFEMPAQRAIRRLLLAPKEISGTSKAIIQPTKIES
jgi:peptidoglycan/LPS O-acetylase OafA/YrhL